MPDNTTPDPRPDPQSPAPRRGFFSSSSGVSRRSFIKTIGASAAASSLSAASSWADAASSAGDAEETPIQGPGPVSFTLTIHGAKMAVQAEPSDTLLSVVRLKLNLTGSKEICDRGACGGCSVMIGGKLVNSCMMLAIDAVGSPITTIEGLAKGGKLDPVQEAFIKHDALQCGYCTPGLVMASRALLDTVSRPTLAQIKRGLSGNICRCGTYTNVFNAVLEASGQSPVMDQKGA